MEAVDGSPSDRINARDRIAWQIRDDIMHGRLKFGQRLPESQYVEKFGVSRTPVREAILSLAALNLLILKPQSGTYVVTFSRESVRDLFNLRFLLESGAPAIASPSQMTKLVDDLTLMLGQMTRKVTTPVEFDVFHDFDTTFHRRLVETPQNNQLMHLYRSVEVCAFAVRSRLDKTDRVADLANEHHAEIVAALKDRQLVSFQTALKVHLDWVVSMLLEIDEIFECARP